MVLGLDPGTRRAGFAVLELAGGTVKSRALGSLTVPAGWPLLRRLARLGQEMDALLRKHRPDEVSVEQGIYAQNVRTALVLGQARGVLLYAAASAGIAVHEYSPREVKRAVSGNGNASKEQVQGMVRRLLGLSRTPGADAADAAALALCHLLRPGRMTPASDSRQRPSAVAGGRRRSSRWTAADVARLVAGRRST